MTATSGRIVFDWEEERDDEPRWMRAKFYPADAFNQVFSTHKEHHVRDSVLVLVGAETLAGKVLDEQSLKKLNSDSLAKVEGKARLKIKRYIHVVDCNQRTYLSKDFEVISFVVSD